MAPPTRREFLRNAGTAMAGLTVPWIAGCGDSGAPNDSGLPASEAGPPVATFQHGVASGDPLHDRVILWTRVTPARDGAAALRCELALDEAMTQLVADWDLETGAARDYTVKLDATGLAPGTVYYYRFSAGAAQSLVGRTRTAPAPDADPAALRFAVVTCADYTRGLYNAYARVAELPDLAAVIHLGDYIYEGGRTNRVRPHDPPHEIVTLADYRRRYASYRETPELQAVHRQHPMIWVWDDHETVDGTWREGADPSNHAAAEDGPFASRKAAALQAALEWLPIRSPDPAQPERIYRSFSFGTLCDLSMLDTRRIGRDIQLEPNASAGFTQSGGFTDPARQLLGAAQETWLAARFTQSGHTWRLLGNQVVMSPLKIAGTPRALGGGGVFANPDQWDGYEPARDRVLDAAAAADVRNLVVLTGDVHASLAFDLVRDPNNPLVYDGLTGRGSEGVEFVAPSISSGGAAEKPPDDVEEWLGSLVAMGSEALRLINPHMKLFAASGCGYLLLKVAPEAVRGEFWLVPTVLSETGEQTLNYAYDCAAGSNRLVEDLSVRLGNVL